MIRETISAGALWFAFIVLYLAFYAGNLDVWQKAAVFLASGVLVGAIVAVYWVTYGFSLRSISPRLQLFGRTAARDAPAQTQTHGGDELFEIIQRRRSIRSFPPGKITLEEFEKLVEAAKWAPSSSNRQTWHFLLTQDEEKIRVLGAVRKQDFVERAPNCILVLVDMQTYERREVSYTPYLDAGAAIENLLLMADHMGLAACWVNFGPMEVTTEDSERVKELFRIPRHFQIVTIIPIGRKTQSAVTRPGRKRTSDIMNLERM
jgi:nitroreductase